MSVDSKPPLPDNHLMLMAHVFGSFRARARCGGRLAMLTLLTAFSCLSAAEDVEVKPLSIRDLEIGMPRDYVLARLLTTYKLTELHTLKAPSSDSLSKDEIVDVSEGDQFTGELYFGGGMLRSASISLYQSDKCDFELLDQLFQSLYDSSRQYKKVEEEPGGALSRTRIDQVGIVSVEENDGHLKRRRLTFHIGEKYFDLETLTLADDAGVRRRSVTLEERITKKWQGDAKPKARVK
jgi:hypothetical protein